jgi:hypothetical protein
MGQAKNRGTFDQRVAQAKAREAARIAEAQAREAEKVAALLKGGMERSDAIRFVRGGRSMRRGALGAATILALAASGALLK